MSSRTQRQPWLLRFASQPTAPFHSLNHATGRSRLLPNITRTKVGGSLHRPHTIQAWQPLWADRANFASSNARKNACINSLILKWQIHAFEALIGHRRYRTFTSQQSLNHYTSQRSLDHYMTLYLLRGGEKPQQLPNNFELDHHTGIPVGNYLLFTATFVAIHPVCPSCCIKLACNTTGCLPYIISALMTILFLDVIAGLMIT